MTEMSKDDSLLPNNVKQLKAMIAEQSVAFDEQSRALAECERAIAEQRALNAQYTQMITEHEDVIGSQHETIAEHSEKIAQREVMIKSQHDTIQAQLKKLEALQQQLVRLLRKQYGPQKERIDPDQLTLFTAEELVALASELQQGTVDSVSTDDGSSQEEPLAEEQTSSEGASQGKPKRPGHGRRPRPDHLPRETVVHELTDEERLCPCCGKLRMPIGSDISEQLEFVPAQLKVIQHERIKYACHACEEHVAIAPKPPQPIDKGLPGPGLLAHVVLSKYGDYQVYSRGDVKEVACMAHCRRYWWEAKETDSRRAHEAISYIARLYTLEIQFEGAGLTGEALRAARQQHATPLLATFETWLRKEQGNVLPKSPIGQAFTYTRNQWQALCRYTENGALKIDNNLAERMVKLPAIGRKNWLFVGSETGGQRAAILLSIIASAKHCQVEPWAWLNAVLKEVPIRLAAATATGPPDLRDLLPDQWLKNHPEHLWKIDELRKQERARSREQKAGSH